MNRSSIMMLSLALLALACGGPERARDLDTRAVVIGIDGADWKVIEQLAAGGEMPNLMGLRARGRWGRIETLASIPLSPVIWTSVATGKAAEKHGITWFLIDQPDGSRTPVRSDNRQCKAIWNILAEEERTAAVVGWWATYPAEQIDSGVIVSDALGFHGFGATARAGATAGKVFPPALYSEISGLMPSVAGVSSEFIQRFVHLSPEEIAAERYAPTAGGASDPLNPLHLFQQYAVSAQGYTAIAGELLAERDDDLTLVYFEQVDSFSHLFMKYEEPRLPWIDAEGVRRYKDVVRNWYRYQDQLLGQLLESIDLDRTAVFVLSDHGFKSGERRIRSEQTVDVRKAHLDHEPLGIFIAAGPHIEATGEEIGNVSVLDVTPTLLHYLGFPVGRDMDGKVLEGIFEQPFRNGNPPRFVPSWEDEEPTPEDNETARDTAGDLTAAEVAERERALRALGYLGGSEPAANANSPRANPGTSTGSSDSSPEIHNNLGRIHLSQGKLDAAADEFQRALELDSGNAGALLNMAALQRAKGQRDLAEHFGRRALQADPSSVAALANLAELARDGGDLEESIRLYQEALEIDDSLPGVHLGLGDSLQRAGRAEAAEQRFRTVLELNPDSFEASYNLGVTLHSRQRQTAALEWFEKALALSPQHPSAASAHNNIGDIYLQQGDVEAAKAAFQTAIDSSPRHLESRFNLASLLFSEGHLEEAIPLLESAANLAPDHELVHTRLGAAYLRAGRNQEAFRSFLLVRRLHPQNWMAAVGLASLHAASGHEQQARQLGEDAIRLGGDPARREAQNHAALKRILGL